MGKIIDSQEQNLDDLVEKARRDPEVKKIIQKEQEQELEAKPFKLSYHPKVAPLIEDIEWKGPGLGFDPTAGWLFVTIYNVLGNKEAQKKVQYIIDYHFSTHRDTGTWTDIMLTKALYLCYMHEFEQAKPLIDEFEADRRYFTKHEHLSLLKTDTFYNALFAALTTTIGKKRGWTIESGIEKFIGYDPNKHLYYSHRQINAQPSIGANAAMAFLRAVHDNSNYAMNVIELIEKKYDLFETGNKLNKKHKGSMSLTTRAMLSLAYMALKGDAKWNTI